MIRGVSGLDDRHSCHPDIHPLAYLYGYRLRGALGLGDQLGGSSRRTPAPLSSSVGRQEAEPFPDLGSCLAMRS